MGAWGDVGWLLMVYVVGIHFQARLPSPAPPNVNLSVFSEERARGKSLTLPVKPALTLSVRPIGFMIPRHAL